MPTNSLVHMERSVSLPTTFTQNQNTALSTTAKVMLNNMLSSNSHSILQQYYKIIPGAKSIHQSTIGIINTQKQIGTTGQARTTDSNQPARAHSNVQNSLKKFDPNNTLHIKFLADTTKGEITHLSQQLHIITGNFRQLDFLHKSSRLSKQVPLEDNTNKILRTSEKILAKANTVVHNKDQIIAFIREHYKSLHQKDPHIITMSDVNKKIIDLQTSINTMERQLQYIGNIGDTITEQPKTEYLDMILSNRKLTTTEASELESIYQTGQYSKMHEIIEENFRYVISYELHTLKEKISDIKRLYPQGTSLYRTLSEKLNSLQPYSAAFRGVLKTEAEVLNLKNSITQNINALKSEIQASRPELSKASIERITNNMIMKEIENLRMYSLSIRDGVGSSSFKQEQAYMDSNADFRALNKDVNKMSIPANMVRQSILKYLHDKKVLKPNEYILLTYKKVAHSDTAHDVNIAVYNYDDKFPSGKTTTIQLNTKNMTISNGALKISNLDRALTSLKKLNTPDQIENFHSQIPTSPITPTPHSPEEGVLYNMVVMGNNEKLMTLYMSNVEHLLDADGVAKYILIDQKAKKWIETSTRFQHLLEENNLKFVTVEELHKMVLKTTMENQIYRNGNPFANPALTGGTTQERQAKINTFFGFISKLIEKRAYAGAKDLLVNMVRLYNKEISHAPLKIEVDADIRLRNTPNRNIKDMLSKNPSESSYAVTIGVTNGKEGQYERKAVLPITYSANDTQQKIQALFAKPFKEGQVVTQEAPEMVAEIFLRGYHKDSTGYMLPFLDFLYELEQKGFLSAFTDDISRLSVKNNRVHIDGNELVLSDHRFGPNTDLMKSLVKAVNKIHSTPELIVPAIIKFAGVPTLGVITEDAQVFPAQQYGVEETFIDGSWGGKGPWTAYESLPLNIDPNANVEHNRGIIRTALTSFNMTQEYIDTLIDPIQKQAAINYMKHGNLNDMQIEARVDYYMEKLQGIHMNKQKTNVLINSASTISGSSDVGSFKAYSIDSDSIKTPESPAQTRITEGKTLEQSKISSGKITTSEKSIAKNEQKTGSTTTWNSARFNNEKTSDQNNPKRKEASSSNIIKESRF